MSFLIVNSILLIILIFLLLALSMFWPPDSPWAPWWRTNKKIAEAICKLAKVNSKDIVYDLGCGDSEVLLFAARKYNSKGVGIEIDIPRLVISKLRVFKNGMGKLVTIKGGNFFNHNLSEASIVNVYLVPRTLERLKPKFLRELKKGTRIVSYRYKINLPLIGEDKKNKLYLYKI